MQEHLWIVSEECDVLKVISAADTLMDFYIRKIIQIGYEDCSQSTLKVLYQILVQKYYNLTEAQNLEAEAFELKEDNDNTV